MQENQYTKRELTQLQALPFEEKVKLSRARIREWIDAYDGKVYVSYSGGKDSTVLLHLVRQIAPEVPAVFSNTGLEYPEVRTFAEQMGVTIIRPPKTFAEVVREEGYPILSKNIASAILQARKFDMTGKNRRYMTGDFRVMRKDGSLGRSMFDKSKWQRLAELGDFRISDRCCNRMKKQPMRKFEREHGLHPMLGTMAEEGRLRERAWLLHGCNAFDARHAVSTPLAFWRETDVLRYIRVMHLPIASVYGEIIEDPDCKNCLKLTGVDRTGCVFCGFGAHMEHEGRYLRLRETHPRLYRYCMEGGHFVDNPDYDPSIPETATDGFRNFNPKQLWEPDNRGLGMGYVFETVNRLYGKTLIPYK